MLLCIVLILVIATFAMLADQGTGNPTTHADFNTGRLVSKKGEEGKGMWRRRIINKKLWIDRIIDTFL